MSPLAHTSLPADPGAPPRAMHVPRLFQFGVLLFVLATGAVPMLLQAAINGSSGGQAFIAAVLTGLIYDMLRMAPLIVLGRHPAGILHPIIIAVVVWPLLGQLPSLIDNFGGYAGLLDGSPLRAPYYVALGWQSDEIRWLAVAKYNGLLILSLLGLYSGFALVSERSGRVVDLLANVDTRRLRNVLIGIILVNFLAVAIFLQLRGGLIQHILELAYGRFRALAGLGPLIALFDIGFLAILLWITTRPQDARHPVFLTLLPLVAIQQFFVAGARSSALIVFVVAGLGWAISMRKVPWRLALVLLPVAFLSFGALNIIRTAGTSGTTVVNAVQDASLQSIIERSREEFDLRQSLIGAVPVVEDGIRTTGPMLGYTYTGAVFAMVPRSLWEGKPRGPGSIYAQTFLGETVEGTAVPIGAVAEAFWNFHVPGVLVLFALYGLILRRAYETYARNPRNGMVATGFVLLATQFGVGTDELVAFQQVLLTFMLLLLIVFLFFPRAFAFRRQPGSGFRPPPRVR